MKKALIALSSILGGFWLLSQMTAILLRFMPEPIGSRADLLIAGARMTLWLTLGAGVLGLLVGFTWGLCKLSPRRVFRWPASFFVWVMRGTPLLVQIMFVYYAVPEIAKLFFDAEAMPRLAAFFQLSEFSASLLALALNVGAYNAEVIRAGIVAVPKGQTEAARSLGLTQIKTMRFIVMPQAIRIVTPPLINNVVALLKDSSLASSIGLLELTLAGNRISSETFLPIPVLTTVALLYLVYTTLITSLADFLDRKGVTR